MAVSTHRDDDAYLFVSCDEAGGRAGRSGRMLANRHVQLRSRASCTDVVPEMQTAACRMMKLKFARRKKKNWGRENVRTETCSWQDRDDVDLRDGVVHSRIWGPHNSSIPLSEVEERRIVHFYTQEVAFDLAGEVESTFWQVYVLQRHHQEPALRQAIVALAPAYWEERKLPNAAMPLVVTSTQQACKAIAELRAYLSKPSKPSHSVVLSGALLLYALERLRGNPEAALCHLDNSISVFQNWTRQHKVGWTAEFDMLQATLARLDGNATIQNMSRVPRLKPPRRSADDRLAFYSAEQMQDWLTMHVCQPLLAIMTRAMAGADSSENVDRQMADLKDDLGRWRIAADHFKASSKQSPKERLAILLNESHYLNCKCSLDEMMGHPSSWNADLEDVWKLAREAVEIQEKLRGCNTAKRWSLTVGITQPLLRFVQNATTEPIRSQVRESIRAYEAFLEYPPMCTSLWSGDEPAGIKA